MTEDAVYTAEYDDEPIAYIITWKNYDGSELDSDTYYYGDTPVYPNADPVRDDEDGVSYIFSGWDPAIVDVTEDAVYTAEYDDALIDYTTVTFNPTLGFFTNEGIEQQSHSISAQIGRLISDPVDGVILVLNSPEGNVLEGWYSNEGCTGNSWNFGADEVTENLVLYANWVPANYEVTFKATDGSSFTVGGSPDYSEYVDVTTYGQRIEDPETITVPTTVVLVSPADNTLIGWFTEENDGHVWDFESYKAPASDFDLYTRWAAEGTEFTNVVFDANGGMFNLETSGDTVFAPTYLVRQETGTLLADPAVELSVIIISPIDKELEGWYTKDGSEDWGQKWNFEESVGSDDFTLYAKWTDGSEIIDPVVDDEDNSGSGSGSTGQATIVEPVKSENPASSGSIGFENDDIPAASDGFGSPEKLPPKDSDNRWLLLFVLILPIACFGYYRYRMNKKY
ncbi:hypothetical protein MmiEs2_00010 [Methanimicrococcus stummii]|uniref:Uncharacterized protein n=1 Tax=Methanimicrococcus stummii TaxID=3028294 RepID=A0AA96V9N0_9EURY|nr:hypothetical protein MmiEs2_00010 [Methanimicrococcus sp. Es2]